MLISGLASLSARRPWSAPRLNLWLARAASACLPPPRRCLPGFYWRAGEEFADVAQEALAIVMTAVRPQGDCGVTQVAQVAHDLAIGRPAKFGLLQDCFFQFGVRDLALRHGCVTPTVPRRTLRGEFLPVSFFPPILMKMSCGPLDDVRPRKGRAHIVPRC